ncbi:hypothetical protein, partial [Pseudomonas syringae]|uniref:hypothetical protein n=1 Tax=Pseudomonas syringae TaxID=317 RepID=UPI001F28F651
MSNSLPVPMSLNEYLAHLPMSDEQRAELAGCTSFAELHERLSAQPVTDPAEAAQASVGRRLTLTTADQLEAASYTHLTLPTQEVSWRSLGWRARRKVSKRDDRS